MSRARTKWQTLTDGEWVRPIHRGFLDQCCHCGLVHRMDFKIIDGKHVAFRATVDPRRTAAARRAFKFTPSE